MEILFLIGGFFLLFILIAPLINAFGSNSTHKDKSQAEKKEEALKDIKKNYDTSKDLFSKGLKAISQGASQLEKLTGELADRAEEYRKEEYEKDYHRMKTVWKEQNIKKRELGLNEVRLTDFFEYNKDYQNRARLEEQQSKKSHTESIKLYADKEFHIELDRISQLKDIEEFIREFDKLLKPESEKQVNPSATDKSCCIKELDKSSLNETTVEGITTIDNKCIPQEINLSNLSKSLIEFIYIRYYLTGETSLPKLQCIYDSWGKSIYTDSELNEEQWQKIIEKMSFNPTKRKKIDALYHFTHKDNLRSILSKGLLTKKNLEDQNIGYKYNDEKRWDGLEDSISLSISRPHHKMFMKYAKPTGMHNWVILKISPTLLTSVENSCLDVFRNYDYIGKSVFNKFNAASFAMKNLTIDERKTHKAFLDMFESNIGKTLETFTFDNQAEILYLDNIPSEFIEEIQVVQENTELSWVRNLGFKLSVNTTVLEKR